MNKHDRELSALLRHGIDELSIALSEATLASLLRYLHLLINWNRAYNLTAVTNPAEIVTKHLLDSLAVVPHIPSGRLLDVGSGAGLPAIPIALARPELAVTALDSNHKKIRFITQVKLEIQIPNLTVVHQRVENYVPTLRYDTIIARAFTSISALVLATEPLLADGGQWLAMKGIRPDAELALLPARYRLRALIPLQVPNLGAERHLVSLISTSQ